MSYDGTSAGRHTFALGGAWQAHRQASDATVAWRKCGGSGLRCEGNNDLMHPAPIVVLPAGMWQIMPFMHPKQILRRQLLSFCTNVLRGVCEFMSSL